MVLAVALVFSPAQVKVEVKVVVDQRSSLVVLYFRLATWYYSHHSWEACLLLLKWNRLEHSSYLLLPPAYFFSTPPTNQLVPCIAIPLTVANHAMPSPFPIVVARKLAICRHCGSRSGQEHFAKPEALRLHCSAVAYHRQCPFHFPILSLHYST